MNTKKLYIQIISSFLLATTLVYGAKAIEGFSVPFEINSATKFHDHLYLATDGGIRFFFQDNQSIVYTADDGLEVTSFYAIASDEQALYAVSANGLIAKQSTLGGDFKVINRSFISGNSQVLKGLILLKGSVMVLAFNDKLAFIDLLSEKSLISLTSIASHRLNTEMITAMTIKDDSIYVAVNHNVYARKMNWLNLGEDYLLADPSTWIKYEKTYPLDTIRAMTWFQDSLVVQAERGTLYYNEEGKKTEAGLNKTALILEGKVLTDSLLIKRDFITKNDTINKDSIKKEASLIEWILKTEKGYYLVGPNTVVYRQGTKMVSLSDWSFYSLGPVHQVFSMNTGGVVAASPYGDLAVTDGYSWTQKWKGNVTPYIFETESVIYKMKSIALDKNGYMIYGLWGGGFLLFKNNGTELYKYIAPGTSCLDEFLANYIVTVASIPAPDQSGFFVSYWSTDRYGFAYIDLDGEVSCANRVGRTKYSGALQVKVSPEDPDQWILFSSSTNVQGLSSQGYLDVFTFTKPSKTGGRLTDIDVKTYEGPNKERILDMDFDRTGRLWVTGYSSLGYLDPDDDEIRLPHKISGFSTSSNSAIATDVQGNIWLGTDQGAYRLSPKRGSPDTLIAQHWKMKDGLLSDVIYDVGIDSVQGMVWFGHDRGITRYKRNDLRKADAFMTDEAPKKPIVYPNPFKPKEHGKVVIDYISEGARVQIFNAGGALVRSFVGQELLGGRLEWNGCDLQGRLVAPGLYHYLIKKGSKVEKGKLLIIH